MNQIHLLRKLWELESKLEVADKEMKRLNQGKEISDKIASHKEVKSRNESLRLDIENYKNEAKILEDDLKEINDKKEALKGKLYGGKINNLKQLGGLLKDEEKVQTEVCDLESKLLDVMGSIEQQQAELIQQEENERRIGGRIKKLLGERQQRLNLTSQEKELLQSMINEIKEEVTKKNMDIYTNVKKRKNNPVVLLNGDICTGCNMDLPIMTLTQIRKNEITLCDNCGRILYIEE